MYRTDDDGTLSDAVIDAIAAAARDDPRETEFVLYESVDPDALDAVFARGRRRGTALSFEVGDLRVDLRGDDRETVHVTVTSPREEYR